MSRVHALREARGEMVRVRLEILTAVVGKSDAELLACPLGGGWSAAEVLDHIRTAEGSLVKALGKLERGEPTRLPAPKLGGPRPRAEIRPADVNESLAASRRELFALVDRMGEERFSRLVFPHFLLGRFTGDSWFRFIAKHEGK